MRCLVMNRPGVLLLIAAVCLLRWSAVAGAQEDNTKNAATWYQRAFEQLQQFTPQEMEMINAYRTNPGQAPSPEVRALINRAAPIVDNVLRAAQQGYSDYGLDYSQGFDLLLPHLGPTRNLARIVQADSALHMADGDGPGAAQRVAALYRLADQAGDDRILISSLVGRAIFEVAEQGAQMGFDRGAFDPASAAILLKATTAFDQRDPFQTLDAIMMEQTLCVDMIRQHLLSDDPSKRSEILAELANESGYGDQLAKMSNEEIEHSLDQYSDLMGRFVEAFSQEDPEVARAQLKEIGDGLENQEFGIIAQLLTPALGRVYDLTMEGRDKLQARIELLEGITKGEVDLQTLTNAAVWYRRGIAAMASLDDPWKKAMAGLDASQPLSAEELDALDAGADASQAAIDQFVQGSTVPRCDFSLERDDREIFVPKYGDGMRDAFRLLAIESLRLAANDDVAGSERVIAACFRMCAHLSDDHLLVSALVARDGFLLASKAAAGIESRNHFDEPSRQDLAAAIRRCGPGDPFGFVGAMIKTREYLQRVLVQWGEPGEREARARRVEAWLKGIDADGLMYLTAMVNVTDFDLTPREPLNRPGAEQLGEYLLAETMDLAGIDAPVFAALLKEGRPDAFELPETIHLVGVTSRMASARSDQWGTYSWALKRAEASRAEAEGEKTDER